MRYLKGHEKGSPTVARTVIIDMLYRMDNG